MNLKTQQYVFIYYLKSLSQWKGYDLQHTTEQGTACCFNSTSLKNDFPVVGWLVLDIYSMSTERKLQLAGAAACSTQSTHIK